MNKIKINTAEKELYYKRNIIMRYKIEYPEIIESYYKEGMKVFNHESRKQALELKELAEQEIYSKIKDTYKNKVYELIRECNIIYNHNQLIAVKYTLIKDGKEEKEILTWNLKKKMEKVCNFM